MSTHQQQFNADLLDFARQPSEAAAEMAARSRTKATPRDETAPPA